MDDLSESFRRVYTILNQNKDKIKYEHVNKVNGLLLRIGEISNFTDGHLVSFIWQNVEIRWILPLWWKII